MTDLFRTALNYIGAGPTGQIGQTNEFVGQIIELGPLRLNIRRLIAEGGFAYIFLAVDQKGIEYALKRLLASDKDADEAIVREINVLKKVSGHPNIICCIQAASIGKDQYNMGRNEYLILTEFCKNGSLVNVMRCLSEPFNCEQITKIFYQTCRAVLHLHSQQPAIVHCDLKVENLLFDSNWTVKLCDFGSATTKTFAPDDSWNAQKRMLVEEELATRTTPMYRAPEMLDLYQNYPINEKLDIWALGCILYYLCYLQHPFEDSAKLRILNAKYSLPSNESKYSVFHDLIYGTLQIDPRKRPGIQDVCDRLEEISAAMNVNLNECVQLSAATLANLQNSQISGQQMDSKPLVKDQQPQQQLPPASSVGGLFGSLKGQAGSILKNIKDTSAKVVQNVQTNKLYGVGGSLFNVAESSSSADPTVRRPTETRADQSPAAEHRRQAKRPPPVPPPVDYKEAPLRPPSSPLPAPAAQPSVSKPSAPPFSAQASTPPVVEPSPPSVLLVEEADLLQLGLEDMSPAAPAPAAAALSQPSSANHSSSHLNDLLFSSVSAAVNTHRQPAQVAGDVLNFVAAAADNQQHEQQTADLLHGWADDNQPTGAGPSLAPPSASIAAIGLHRNVSAPSLANTAQPKLSSSTTNVSSNALSSTVDPFEDLAHFHTSGRTSPNTLYATISSQPRHPTHMPSSIKPQAASYCDFSRLQSEATRGPGPAATRTSTPVTSTRPNYSRSNFETTATWSQNVGPKPKIDDNTFDDLLSGQSFPFSSSGGSKASRSMGAMKRQQENKELDVNAIKIRDWTEGKQRNVRALLCSMHTVIWEENDKWDGCTMAQLLTPAQVKKFYRKACLAVHPDKLTGSEHLELARLIFTELNDAWNEFAKTEQLGPL